MLDHRMSDAQPKALHVKCERNEDGKLRGLSYDNATGNYLSGWWNLTDEQAETLVSGWLYLHPPGAELAEIGGKILSFDQAHVTSRGNEARVIFTFDYSKEARHQPWRGSDFWDRKVWHGGFVDATLRHESEATRPT